ncbi:MULTISPECIES: hypothetical protein [Pirellulaceae]|nr:MULTISPECIES: hypothetical protein [Pirellulaceae]
MRIVLASEKPIPSREGDESWTHQLGKWLLSKNYDVHKYTR